LVTGQLNVQIHHVTVLGLDRYHAWCQDFIHFESWM
jgi:hypothetical protein